jgi:hypothetical protein
MGAGNGKYHVPCDQCLYESSSRILTNILSKEEYSGEFGEVMKI